MGVSTRNFSVAHISLYNLMHLILDPNNMPVPANVRPGDVNHEHGPHILKPLNPQT